MNEEEITLPSGAVLVIRQSPFAVSKALYQAILKEIKAIQFSSQTELAIIFKDIFCMAFSSSEIDSCLWKCFERCTIDGMKIDKDSFEKPERRQDFMQVCVEVAKANISPFVKSLYAQFQQFSKMIGKGLA